MKLFEKGSMFKFENKIEGYIIYFENQDEAAKHLNMTVERMNKKIHFKKGVMDFIVDPEHPTNTEFDRMRWIDNILTRIFYKPSKIKFNEIYYK